jgi:hypothetical protein
MISPAENFSGKTGTPEFSTLEGFKENVIAGSITDADGVGYYANKDKISAVRVVLSELTDERYDNPEVRQAIIDAGGIPPMTTRMADATHVAWFPNGG